MNRRFLDLLRERVLFFDGAMGTQLQARELKAADFGGARWEGCYDHLSLTRPDVVEGVHAAYFEAGADVVETNSFQASRVRLDEWGLGRRRSS
jgi:5-methyltetrahydrofolate--homocysteine methyltransferase